MPAPKGHEPYPGCEKGGENGGRKRRYSVEDIECYGNELLEWMKDDANVWFKDFCLEKGIDPDLFSQWAKENEYFGYVIRMSKAKQESRILKGGFYEQLNPGLVKFCLMNCHGWSDKTESKLSGDAANPLGFLLQQADGKSKSLLNIDEENNE